MSVESADDLAGFFDPDEFGEPMTAGAGLEVIPFSGIFTTGPSSEQPGTVADITGYVPRIIAAREQLADLQQGDTIVRANGDRFQVNDIQRKGDLLIIFLHDNW